MAAVTRPMSQMRKMETKEALFRARKRILKYLVLGFLKQEGCMKTADTFSEEAHLTGEYEVCDNIDLDIIIQDYISYYMMRFNKQPQFCRKVDLTTTPPAQNTQNRRPAPKKKLEQEAVKESADLPSTFTVMKISKEPEPDTSPLPSIEARPLSALLKSLSPDKRPLAESLYQDIVRHSPTSWSDIMGAEDAKCLLMEAVVYPIKHREVFTGILEPWRGVLLHGPPGTGKTLLAKAVAAEGHCTFFNISCSTIVNKWRGESEKIVNVLFTMACYYAPSIIFIDEVETLTSQRGCTGEHDASRRLKAQLLTELDGVTAQNGVVFLLANSNMPWEIDPAMLRRLEKRIHVPLPDFKTRVDLFQHYLNCKLPKGNLEELASKTEGYSGSDIKLVCKEALMANVRKMLPNMKGKGNQQSQLSSISLSQIFTAIEKTKPVSKNQAQKHNIWQNEMGCS